MSGSPDDRIVLSCPKDGYFITEIRGDYGRGICPQCGGELTYRSKAERRRERGSGIENPEQTNSLERTVSR